MAAAGRRLHVQELDVASAEGDIDKDRLLERQQTELLAAQERAADLELQLRRAREREAHLVLAAAPKGDCVSPTLLPFKENISSFSSSTSSMSQLYKWGERELQNSQHALKQAQTRAGSLEKEVSTLRARLHELETRVQDLEAENRVAVDYMLRQKVYTQRGPCDEPDVVAEHVHFLQTLLKERKINFPVTHVRENVYLFRDTELDLVVHQGRLLVRTEDGNLQDFLELLAKRPAASPLKV
ncbi:Hypothetical Protein FCC1311_012232 [Hondaea fermentalgiana]|uniref:Uncharacterized protein n=1 Tax=Hondaea fermentalgiana TaxID=2315210 RepID=A0A2R5G1W2_9STRA|nr:Hypothetical Protein FCC1311_012232 [Hondaea fermentalgiana]|eukprot:GBG25006.1 Hypothetical Protein FCC1311_012232 [Hondaea fermentalgiana]